jgi:hypothetical protein
MRVKQLRCYGAKRRVKDGGKIDVNARVATVCRPQIMATCPPFLLKLHLGYSGAVGAGRPNTALIGIKRGLKRWLGGR